MKTTLLFLLASAAVLNTPLAAQIDNNNHAWLMYFGDHPLTPKSRWGVHLEGQWRRADVGLTWQQLLLRPAVNFQLNKKVSFTGGYGFVRLYRYDDYPVRERFDEHRTFEQAQITQRFAGLDWSNRLRFEQRHFLGYAARYENRFRYMLRTSVPLPWHDRRYYVGLYDEVFFNFGKNVGPNVFDQNRAYIALGRQMAHQTRLEVGYLEQTLQQPSGRVTEHNHTLQVAIYSRLPFGH